MSGRTDKLEACARTYLLIFFRIAPDISAASCARISRPFFFQGKYSQETLNFWWGGGARRQSINYPGRRLLLVAAPLRPQANDFSLSLPALRLGGGTRNKRSNPDSNTRAALESKPVAESGPPPTPALAYGQAV